LESFPHIEFWVQLPSLAREGLLFLMGKAKGAINKKFDSSNNGYANV